MVVCGCSVVSAWLDHVLTAMVCGEVVGVGGEWAFGVGSDDWVSMSSVGAAAAARDEGTRWSMQTWAHNRLKVVEG